MINGLMPVMGLDGIGKAQPQHRDFGTGNVTGIRPKAQRHMAPLL
jgi:hypothetical protein